MLLCKKINKFSHPFSLPQGDGIKFVIGQVYTQPNALPGARVLREGGNGLILEVNSVHAQLNYLYQLF